MPGAGDQPLGADDQARLLGLVGDVAAEFAVAVGEEDDVVGRLGGQQADVVAAALARIVAQHEGLRGDDPEAELGGRAGEGVGQRRIVRQRATQHENPAPVLCRKILGHRIGQHGAAGDHVHQSGAAIGAAQPVGGLGDVEQQHPVVAQRIGQRQQRRRVGIDDDEAGAAVVAQPPHGRRECIGRRRLGAREIEVEAEGAADYPALAQRRLGAGVGTMSGLQLESGIAADLSVARIVDDLEIADGERRPFGGGHGERYEQQQGEGRDGTHQSSIRMP